MDQLTQLLTRFGHSEFRGQQRAVIECVLRGQSALALWPTGLGKSLCYQLPALQLEQSKQAGLILVVSPLIALMDDQVAKAQALGLPFTAIHSALRPGEREQRLQALAEQKFRLVYVTPERFRKEAFWQALAEQTVALLAIDEAHCISQWGHDFRPEYSRLGEIRRELGAPPVLALTATATREVQSDILAQLGLPSSTATFFENMSRPNLFLGVEEVYGFEGKMQVLQQRLKSKAGTTLIYCALISTVEKVYQALVAQGHRPQVYHGQIGDRQRAQVLARFMEPGDHLLVATPAFGLGVDKPDIRSLIHFELPGSLEAYYQEVGRAGRDGGPAECWLFWDEDDVSIQMNFIQWATPDVSYVRALDQLLRTNLDKVRSLGSEYLRQQLSFKNKSDFRLETALNLLDRFEVISWPGRDYSRLEILDEMPEDWLDDDLWRERQKTLQKKLLAMVQWMRAPCRKQKIYEYFGQDAGPPCGQCDQCLKEDTE